MARARPATIRPMSVGAMPRAVRTNSGAPNMDSSSDKALVTAGWLVAISSATRVREPSRWTCTISCRWRIFSRETNRRTTSSEGKPESGMPGMAKISAKYYGHIVN